MIDLHTHSTASDGTFTPRQVAGLAVEHGLKAVALTDHDTVDGITEFMAGATGNNIRLIPGVEISAIFNKRELHMVGLFVDTENRQLLDLLAQIRRDREYRNLIIVQRVCDMGYEISYDEVMAEAGGDVVGRPHFAGVLMRKYDFSSRQAVFDACLKRGTRGYVPRKLPQPQQVIEAVHAAGGCVVWGHPIYRDKGERSFMRRVLKVLVPVGLDAVEAYYSSFSPAQESIVKDLADEFNLALSGGSDFHGANIPEIELGTGYGELNVPDELLNELEKRAGG
ncbi:MAG: PHP domain-containing protein [Victivallaceae bacterium]|nr:PHP domain-containing protein [Victivallaceae bacterium]